MTMGVIELNEDAAETFNGVRGFTNPGWYFWNHDETELVGPFKTSDRAQIAMGVYFCSDV